MEDGAVFTINDFADVADSSAIRKILSREEAKGRVERLLRGIYHKSHYSDFFMKFIPPSPKTLAEAIARCHGWRILPHKKTALRIMGMIPDEGNIWEFISSGPYREYETCGVTVRFKQTYNEALWQISRPTALISQCIQALGEHLIHDENIKVFRYYLSEEDCKTILSEAHLLPAWVAKCAVNICRHT